MKTKIFIPALLFLCIGNTAQGQVSHTVTFNANYSIENIVCADSNTYCKIDMVDLHKTDSIGYPALPVKYVRLLIPQNTNPESIIINSATTSISYLSYPVEPVQMPIPISSASDTIKFVGPDLQRYSSHLPYPVNIVQISDDGYFRGHHIVTIAVYPFHYTPAENKLEIISSINFTLLLTINSIVKIQKNDETTLRLLEYTIDNKGDIKQFSSSSQPASQNGAKSISITCDYVIVTSASLAPAFNRFMAWKKRKGIDIKLVTIEDIYANYTGDNISGINDSAGKVRQFLSDAYDNGLQYALLAGDHTIVPIRLGYSSNTTNNPENIIPTDLYYSEFDGDWKVDADTRYGEPDDDDVDFESEIYVGRIMVTNTNEVEIWTEKLLKYELNPGNGSYSYLTRAFFTQADQLQQYNQANAILDSCNWITSRTVFNEDNNLSNYCTSYVPSYPKGEDVIEEFNNNYGFCSFMGHGGFSNVAVATLYLNTEYMCDYQQYGGSYDETKYKITAFDNGPSGCCIVPENGNGFDNMTNYNFPAIYYSISCLTMPFDDFNHSSSDRNMGESFTVINNSGGAHYLGNTRNGYVFSSYDMFNFFVRIISNSISYKLGVAEALSKSQMPYSSFYVKYSHNLLGCPETEIWTATPTLYSNVTVTENGSNVTVNTGGVNGSTICVMSALDNGSSYFQVVTNVSSNTFYNVPQPYLVTITKHDYIPYLKDPDNIYIQNVTIDSDRYIYGVNFFAGENVTNQIPQGPVTITNDANVVFDASNEVNIEGGFEIESGSSFEIKKH